MHHVSQINGITPQHLAVTWPVALKHLIQAHADVNARDFQGRRPIHLAIALKAHDSINLLLEADCALAPYVRGEGILLHVLIHESPAFPMPPRQTATIETITKAYINRHKRLRELARSVLSLEQAQRLNIAEGVMCECTTVLINQAISARGVHVPPALELGTESVYEVADFHGMARMPPEMASTLWESGFRDIWSPNEQGLSPILQNWHCANFEMVQWFIDKGVSPDQQHRDGNFGALHVYAQRIHYPGFYFRWKVENVPTSPLLIPHLYNLEASRDDCRCLCSPAGCSPVTFFNRYPLEDSGFAGQAAKLSAWAEMKFSAWVEKTSLITDNNQGLWDTYARDMVRILAFDFLSSKCPDLDHTCCSIGQLGQVKPDAIRDEGHRYMKQRYNGKILSTCNIGTGPHCVLVRLLALENCEGLMNQIMGMYDEWQVGHDKSVATLPWDFMNDAEVKSRYENLVEESSTGHVFLD